MRYHYLSICIVTMKQISAGKDEEQLHLLYSGTTSVNKCLAGPTIAGCSREIKRHLLLGRKAVTNLDSVLKSRDITLVTQVCMVKAVVFPSVMHSCESGTIKKAEDQRIWTVVWEKTLVSPLDCKEIQPVHPKGNQPWVVIVRTNAEAPIFWPPDVKSCLTGEDPDSGKDWGQEKVETEDEMVGWYHWLNGHKFDQTPGHSQGQGSLACCSPWGHKESATTGQLNYNYCWRHTHTHIYVFCKLIILLLDTYPIKVSAYVHTRIWTALWQLNS